MGICCEYCNGRNDDYDLINIKVQNDRKSKKTDFQNQTEQSLGINDFQQSKINKNNNSSQKMILSKKKLKLTIIQSKCLEEGKEFIINSLGLVDSKNDNKDGLVIFGDINVRIYIKLKKKYRQIPGQTLYSLQKKVIPIKIMQRFVIIEL